MRKCVLCLIATIALGWSPGVVLAQSTDQDERVAAAFVLALGRAAAADEAQRWAALPPLSIAELVGRHRRALEQDGAAERDVIVRAARDAFGRVTEAGAGPPDVASGTYYELVQRHLRWLGEHPADYQQTIHRAYRVVLQRDAYSIEIEYWKRQPVLTFALLVGCVENWAVRNQPGLTSTSGLPAISMNSAYLVTVRLSPAVGAEARAVVSLAPAGERTLAAATGRHVIAPGAADIVSVGGIHFVAAGNSRLDDASGKPM